MVRQLGVTPKYVPSTMGARERTRERAIQREPEKLMVLLREKVVMVTADGCKLTLPDISMEQVNLQIKQFSQFEPNF